jgi:hypothetical protein
MATVETPPADVAASLTGDDPPLTDRERDEKARALASHLAESLLAELAPGEVPVLWETIAPQKNDWLDLLELCEWPPDTGGMKIPKISEEQIIISAFFNHTAQQAAFLLGVAIGQRLALSTDKGGGK